MIDEAQESEKCGLKLRDGRKEDVGGLLGKAMWSLLPPRKGAEGRALSARRVEGGRRERTAVREDGRLGGKVSTVRHRSEPKRIEKKNQFGGQ